MQYASNMSQLWYAMPHHRLVHVVVLRPFVHVVDGIRPHQIHCHAEQDQEGSPDHIYPARSSSQPTTDDSKCLGDTDKQPNMIEDCLRNSWKRKQSAWFSTKEPQWLQLQSQSSYLRPWGQTHPAVCSLCLGPVSPEGHPAT